MSALTAVGQNADSSHDETFSELANQLVERIRSGELLTVERLAVEYPEREAEIRQLFPLLQLMESLHPLPSTAAGGSSDTVGNFSSPWHLGEYRILRRIGQGGMGTVYEARHDSLGRNVALKVLSICNSRNSTLLERFKREARAAASLHHSNIVPVFSIGESDGLVYYAMQLIHGISLDRFFNGRGPVTEAITGAMLSDGRDRYQWIAHIGAEVADALAHAHAHGVLHRDIKPGNILIASQGDVWVTDFGLAQVAGVSDLTACGDVVGTLRYVPPENFSSPGDARGDIYSLGLTLYELLTQSPSFGSVSREELIHRILHMPLPSSRIADKRIPRDLDTIVTKATAREPGHRYCSAQALAQDLRLFSAGEPILARRLSLAEKAWHWMKKNFGVAVTIVLVGALLLVVSAVSTRAYLFESRSREKLESTLIRAIDAEEQVRHVLLHSYLATAEAAQHSRRQGQRQNSLKPLNEAARLLPGMELEAADTEALRSQIRDLTISGLALPDIRELGLVKRGMMLDFFHLDRCAQLDADGNLHVYQWPRQVEVAHLAGVNEGTWISFTPNRDELLLVEPATRKLARWQIDQSRSTPIAEFPEYAEPFQRCEFSRDGRHLLLSDRIELRRWVAVLEWPSGQNFRQRQVPFVGGIAPSIGMSPDGQLLAVIDGPYGSEESHRVRIIDIRTQSELNVLNHSGSVQSVAWYPDSRSLAAGLADSNDIVIWDTRIPKQIGLLKDQRGGGPWLCASSNELLVSSSLWTQTMDLWHAQTFKSLMRMPSDYIFAWSLNDGRMLGERRSSPAQWQYAVLEPSSVLRTLARSPASVPIETWRDLSVHRDGRLLAVGSNQGVFLFDLLAGQQIGHLPVGYSIHPWFVPDTGDLLTYSERGLMRWPIAFSDALSTDKVPSGQPGLHTTIGPPKMLPCVAAFGTSVSSDNSGRVIAVAAGSNAFILHNDGERIIELKTAEDCRQIFVSPNGLWVASGTHVSGIVELWNADTGEKQLLPDAETGWVHSFSPDSQTLSVSDRLVSINERNASAQEYDAFDKNDVKDTCFSPDGRLLVSLHSNGASVYDIPSRRKLGTLSIPDKIRYTDVTITPNGHKILCSSNDHGTIDVWDLQVLNKELSAMNLGWQGIDAATNEAREVLPTMTIVYRSTP